MKNLYIKSLAGVLFMPIAMGVCLFPPAGTLHYWQAWVFLAEFTVLSLLVTVYLMVKDPKLLERRVSAGPTAEKEPAQKIIMLITMLGFITMLVVPAFDFRFGLSSAPSAVSIVGYLLIAVAYLIIFFVFKQNTFASATIELAPDQKVISTGLYALVRHPMYFGGLFIFIGLPLALGSWWGLLVFLLILPALIWRIFNEEKFLSKNLPGYLEYKQKTKYRLVPLVW